MSRVDVIVPCYNYGRYLRECVRSALTQEGVEVRVLIIDDASHDDSEQVGRNLAAQDSRVEFRRHALNRGHIETYNEGLDWASGEYTLLLSADDVLTPGALARAACVMDAHPEVGLTYGRAISTAAPSPHDFTPPAEFKWSVKTGAEWLAERCAGTNHPVLTPTAVVRTAIQRRIGGYSKELPHAGDLEMWMRFAAHAAVGFVGADQAYYRTHASNMFLRYSGILDLRQRKEAFDYFFRTCGDLVPDSDSLKKLAQQRDASMAVWRAMQAFEAGDCAACRDIIAFARAEYPRARFGLLWRLKVKQLLGPKAWSAVAPIFRRLRRGRHTVATGVS